MLVPGVLSLCCNLGMQVNLMALQRLLDFGSSYEPALKAATGRGARETMQFGVIG